ncbi:MAG TPA: PQQ-binding-like beta-propeller repeat protein [Methanomassiliicoccales archaeon]
MDLDRNGTLLWKYVFEGSPEHNYFLSDHPVIDNSNTSYIAVSEYTLSSYYQNNSQTQVVNVSSYLCAISSNGEVKWKHTFNSIDPSGYSQTVAADISGNLIYALADNDHLYALDKNGIESWNVTFPSSFSYGSTHGIFVSPDDAIYVTSDYSVWAVDPQGSLSWNRTFVASIGQGIGTGGRGELYVYVNTNDFASPAALYSFDANGTRLWKVESGSYSSSPIIVDKAGTVIYGVNGILHAVDRNGTKLWSYDAGENVRSTGLDGEGRLFILTYSSLAVSNGIPKVTWIDWIVRNPIWDLVIVIVLLAIVYVGVVYRRRKKNPPKE